MKCDRCGEQIPVGEETEHHGRILCEECYMQALSPSVGCDPWAVQSAKKLSQMEGAQISLSEKQAEILKILEETSGLTPQDLAERLHLRLPELEREIATLRHMEKIRGRMESGKAILILWNTQ
jgi:recombinational DNA repair protein (RecF pathway)